MFFVLKIIQQYTDSKSIIFMLTKNIIEKQQKCLKYQKMKLIRNRLLKSENISFLRILESTVIIMNRSLRIFELVNHSILNSNLQFQNNQHVNFLVHVLSNRCLLYFYLLSYSSTKYLEYFLFSYVYHIAPPVRSLRNCPTLGLIMNLIFPIPITLTLTGFFYEPSLAHFQGHQEKNLIHVVIHSELILIFFLFVQINIFQFLLTCWQYS